MGSHAIAACRGDLLVVLLWILTAIFLRFRADVGDEHDFIIGSVIGVIAAPWVWLHFARRMHQPDAQPPAPVSTDYKNASDITPHQGQAATTSDQPTPDPEISGNTVDFDRYRLLTIMLAAALLVVALLPYLGKWLNNANKIEAFGVSLTLSATTRGRGELYIGGHIPPTSELGADRLSDTTYLADNIERGGREINEIGPDMRDFYILSSIDRERAYIAFLTYTRLAEFGSHMPGSEQTVDTYINGERSLDVYIKTAERAQKIIFPDPGQTSIDTDRWFLHLLRPLPNCINWYQDKVKDYHLFTVSIGPFLRSLAVTLRGGTEGFPIDPDFPKVRAAAVDLSRQIADIAGGIGFYDGGGKVDCADEKEVSSRLDLDVGPDYPYSHVNLGSTPYPVMMLAYYMAAIDSVESGVEALNDWLTNFRNNHSNIQLDLNPQLGWYEVRAMLAASQLPYFFGGLTPTHRALVRYQQQMTDKMAALLDVGSPDAWQRFCRRIAPRTLHSQLGRRLAFLYATERYYLFELLLPEDFADPGEDYGLSSIVSTPDRFIAEANAVLKDVDCLSGVPDFEDRREQYVGMFHLYLAQLQIAKYQRVVGGERDELRAHIRSEINLAGSLGNSPGSAGSGLPIVSAAQRRSEDLLAQPDEFDRHRERLLQLQEWLKRNAPT